MSHIRETKVAVPENIPVPLLKKTIEVVGLIMQSAGYPVECYIYDWEWQKRTRHEDIEVILGIGAGRGEFRGVGVGINSAGKLQFFGDFYVASEKMSHIKKIFEKNFPAALQLAAKVMLKEHQGKKVEFKICLRHASFSWQWRHNHEN